MTTQTERCSSLPRRRLCPASGGASDVSVDVQDPSGAMGTAAHAGIRQLIETGAADIAALAFRYDVDAEELAKLVRIAGARWRSSVCPDDDEQAFGDWFPNSQFEVSLAGGDGELLLTGHPDLYSVVGPEVRLADWKFGALDLDYGWQLRGYSWLLLERHPECDLVRVCLVRVLGGTADWQTFTRDQLAEWWLDLKAHLRQQSYNPGHEQCRFCPRALSCSARTEWLRQSVTALAIGDVELAPLACFDALDRCKQIEKLCAGMRALVKLRVAEAGGVLPIGNGKELAIEQRAIRELDYLKALPALHEAGVSKEEIAQLVELPLTKAEKAVGDKAAPKCKAKDIKAFLARLDELGAVSVTYQERLEVRKSTAPVQQLTEQAS